MERGNERKRIRSSLIVFEPYSFASARAILFTPSQYKEDGELTLENNLELSVLPKFEITDPSTTYVTIYGNPKLDTEDIIQTCKARKCAVAAIQRPFSCGFPLPKKVKCRVVEGTVRMEKSTAKQMEDVEEIRGHLIFRGSELTSFPKFKNLRILTQRGKEKVLTVSNNPDLEDIVALYGVTIHNETANAVEIEKNPKLCVEDRERNVEFVWKFMQQIPRCKFSTTSAVTSRKRSRSRGSRNRPTPTSPPSSQLVHRSTNYVVVDPAQPRGSSKGQKGKKASGKKLSKLRGV